MLSLPDVTLCCIDTRWPKLALSAMKKCQAKAQFGNAVLFTSTQHGISESETNGIRIIELSSINNIEDYSKFLIKGLEPYIHTTHTLIVQWDGYILNPEMWKDEYLSFDYIGSVWPQYSDNHRVGNGGFSLRSRRLLVALNDTEITPQHPEDTCIARTNRDYLESKWNIRFADEITANDFAFERTHTSNKSFGFHGLSNFPKLLTPEEIHNFANTAPAELFAGLETRLLVKRMLKMGLKETSLITLKKRGQFKRLDFSEIKLWIRYWLATNKTSYREKP